MLKSKKSTYDVKVLFNIGRYFNSYSTAQAFFDTTTRRKRKRGLL